MPELRCYRLHERVDGKDVRDFDDYVDLDEGKDTAHEPVTVRNFTAKLYVSRTQAHVPRWTTFLAPAREQRLSANQEDARDSWPMVSTAGALLVVRLDDPAIGYFAFTFGTGRFLLKSGAYRRAYGVRTTLNLLYPTGVEPAGPAPFRSVDTSLPADTGMRTRRQATKSAPFEAFDVDRMRAIVRNLVGTPAEEEKWGTRISGGDSFGFSRDIDFADLGDLCLEVGRTHDRQDYRERFAWVDNFQPVLDGLEKDELAEVVRDLVTAQDTELDLAPPSITDWDRVVGFRLPQDRGKAWRPELRLKDYLALFRDSGMIEDMTIETLRKNAIRSVDGNETTVDRWSVWKCLVGNFTHGDATYVIEDGEFWRVDRDFLEELEHEIDSIDQFHELPDAGPSEDEASYNSRAANELGYLNLDRKNVTIPQRTTPVEICDLLTEDGKFIHVKRDFYSGKLSHLFSQGTVSADLLHEDRDFRRESSQKVASEDAANFVLWTEAPVDPSRMTVVYAIIGDWKSLSPGKRLPFFSKVNLRNASRHLASRGYVVAVARVQTLPV